MDSLFIYPDSSSNLGLSFARECALSIKKSLGEKSDSILEFIGPTITAEQIKKELVKNLAKNFLAFGHGHQKQITISEDKRPVFESKDSPSLQNMVCYFLACCTGKEIGPEAIKNGATAFLGFTKLLLFSVPFQQDFLECCISGMKEFLNGDCVLQEIEIITRQKFEEKMEYFLSIGKRREAGWCLYNMSSLVFLKS